MLIITRLKEKMQQAILKISFIKLILLTVDVKFNVYHLCRIKKINWITDFTFNFSWIHYYSWGTNLSWFVDIGETWIQMFMQRSKQIFYRLVCSFAKTFKSKINKNAIFLKTPKISPHKNNWIHNFALISMSLLPEFVDIYLVTSLLCFQVFMAVQHHPV